METLDLIYCDYCLDNIEDDAFDYRFEFPVCFDCVQDLELAPTDEYDEE